MSEKKQSLVLLAIFSFAFIAMGVGTITPAIAAIAAAFPTVGFSTILLVSTIPSLVSIPVALIGGSIAGKSVKYRTLVIFATVMFLLGGIAPYFLKDFALILVSRGLFGVGIGLIMPLNTSLIFNLIPPEKQANIMGINGVVMNIGGIVLQLLGGVTASIAWNYSFLVHGFALITLILVIIFLPEPKKVDIPANADAPQEKRKLPASIYGWSLIFLISAILYYPSLTNMSSVLETIGAGSSVAAIVLMFMTVGGMVAGAIFGKVFGKFGKYTLIIGLVFFATSQILFATSQSVALFTIGEFIMGLGLTFVMTSINMLAGASVHPSQTPIAMSIIVSGMNLGGFLSGYFYAALMGTLGFSTLRFQYYSGTIGFAALLVFFIILFASKKNATPMGQAKAQ